MADAGLSPPSSERKNYRLGTHRVRAPEWTWEWIAPHRRRYGITRVADITGLDTIGIAVFMAIRPAARTLSVSQGKGLTPMLARVSAVMEAIELWHAENVVPRTTDVPARRIGTLPYDVRALAEVRSSLWHEDLPIDWVTGEGLCGGRPIPVPLGCVRLDAAFRPEWAPPLFAASSNGLASGNTLAEATAHGLLELIERHTVADLRREPVDYLAVDSVDDPECRALVDRFHAAGVVIRVQYAAGVAGTHVFEANGWADTAPARFAGWGCHLDPAIALARALTEAAQSRLTAIAGSRDDDEDPVRNLSRWTDPRRPPDLSGAQSVGWATLEDRGGATLDEDIRTVVTAIAAAGHEPIRVTLPSPTGVPVVKIIAPGLRGPLTTHTYVRAAG